MLDIDPGDATTWEQTLLLARLHRDALAHLKVRAYPKLTGRRGVQVWVPVAPGYTFAETRAWAEKLSKTIGRVVPDLVSWKWSVESRGGLARLDYTQNAVNKTLVAPYGTQGRAGSACALLPGSGTSLATIQTCGRTAGRSEPCWIASRRAGTRSAPSSAWRNACRRSDTRRRRSRRHDHGPHG